MDNQVIVYWELSMELFSSILHVLKNLYELAATSNQEFIFFGARLLHYLIFLCKWLIRAFKQLCCCALVFSPHNDRQTKSWSELKWKKITFISHIFFMNKLIPDFSASKVVLIMKALWTLLYKLQIDFYNGFKYSL